MLAVGGHVADALLQPGRVVAGARPVRLGFQLGVVRVMAFALAGDWLRLCGRAG
jgi:hypothetical protein